VAEDDGLTEIPACIDELVTDPEEVLRRLPVDGDARSESRMDKEVLLRFMTEGKGGEKIEVVLRKADPRPGVGKGEAVGVESDAAAVVKKELLILPPQVIVEEHRFMIPLKTDQIRAALLEVEEGIDYPPRVRAAIEVIAEKDEGVADRVDSDPVEKQFQLVVTAVDVTDGQYPACHLRIPLWSSSAAVLGEESVDELPGSEWSEVVHLLAHADVAKRNVQLLGDPDDDAPFCRPVQLCQDQTGDADLVLEHPCLGDGVLTRSRVKDEEDLMRRPG
jgi:hypothetical protein